MIFPVKVQQQPDFQDEDMDSPRWSSHLSMQRPWPMEHTARSLQLPSLLNAACDSRVSRNDPVLCQDDMAQVGCHCVPSLTFALSSSGSNSLTARQCHNPSLWRGSAVICPCAQFRWSRRKTATKLAAIVPETHEVLQHSTALSDHGPSSPRVHQHPAARIRLRCSGVDNLCRNF